MSKLFRYYQEEANDAIYEELLVNTKCIVKMFCGTGKSLLMRKCKTIEGKQLVVYVFPSLSLIDQFYSDYLYDFPAENMLKVSSENESTTDPIKIRQFLSKTADKIVCVTYQSFKTLLDNLDKTQINVCIFDEAHHAVGETYQTLIFDNDVCEKQIFFTATPKNANGIIMYDRENIDAGMCGKLVYDYSYLRGMNEGYLNSIDIRIDMFLENTNKSLYESIARAVLSSGNNRVLTFHSDVNTERDTSVNNFVNDAEFKCVFREVQRKEFPQIKNYKKVSMIGFTASITSKKRKTILERFDETPANEVMVISSCETIGEGIDTKNANMCVFVDPKSSYVKIIQNIGRIVRKVFEQDKPNSTVLIPCWVDKSKYLECGGDREKCDEVIRQDMGQSGNFNGILNVLSALKQEDEDLYDICLYYPDTFSPQEISTNLEKQGYTIEEPVGDGELVETMEYLLDTDVDYDDYDTEEEMIMSIAEDNDVCVEIHTTSLENPVERYNTECESGETIRLYYDSEEEVYCPIVEKGQGKKRNGGKVTEPNRQNRMNMRVHTHPDVQVLWKITSDIDMTKDICSCVIDCKVVDNWFENFEKLTTFIDKNKKTPYSNKSREQNEKRLRYWLNSQQKNYKNIIYGMKDETKYNLWTTFLQEYREYFKSHDEVWYETFEDLKKFINENKKRPSNNVKNEQFLGSWILTQQSNYKKKLKSMKDKTKYELWTAFLGEYREYFKNHDEVWYETFEDLKKFINENKKRPSNNVENEKFLGSWISTQQSNYKKKLKSMKDKTKYELWTTFLGEYQDYFKSIDKKWYEHFEEIKQFINVKKKRPSEEEKEPNETFLGNWITNQQSNYKYKTGGMKDETRYKLWTAFLEEYKEYFKSDDDIWYDHFEDLKKFINENKKNPSHGSKEPNEKSIGNWLSHQQKNYKNKNQSMKDKTRYKLWTAFLEEYNEYLKSHDEVWYENFEELKTFINKNKKRPSTKSQEPNEKTLGIWISTQQSNYKNKKQSMKDETKYKLWSVLLQEYQEYFNTDDDVWYENFEELKIFINKNKKRPSYKTTDPNEKILGNWINNQKNNYKNKTDGMKDDTRYNLWTVFLEEYKEYFKSHDEVWYENLEELKTFINKNKKTPSHGSKEPNEKILGNWISSQTKNYKKKTGGMKDNTRYNLWTAFLEEYKEYFKDDVSDTQSTTSSEPPKPIKSMKLKKPSTKKSDQKRQRIQTELSQLHRTYKTLKSENLHTRFTENPELWHEYHTISEENEKSFPEDEIPRNRIIQELNKIQTRRTKLVVDMGCGKGDISKHFASDPRFQFINYDHVSSNETITTCDISKLPEEENSVEICILSLAMWGSNNKQYITEAHRVLESGGKLYIIEPTKRWSEQDENGNIIEGKEASKMKSLLEESGFKIIDNTIEKFCLFICLK
jgi:ribosomal RNA-processing protein 8